MLATFSLLVALTASVAQPLDQPPVPTVEVASPQGTLHGDWETPRVVAVVFSDVWVHVLARLVEAVAPSAEVWMLLEDGSRWHDARRFVRSLPPHVQERVHLLRLRTDTVWIRDYGPMQAREQDGSLRWIDNAYLGDRRRDDRVPAKLSGVARTRMHRLGAAIDGGAVASNGRGVCITTQEYLDSESIDAADSDALGPIAAALGCRVLAAVPALASEPTMHVDPFLQFLAPHKVAVATIDEARRPDDHRRLEMAVAAVVSASSRLGQPLEVVRVPLWVQDDRYYSYINGLQLADRLVVPAYDSVPLHLEHEAHDVLREAVDHRTLVPILADELVEAQGVIHCITLGLDVDPGTARRSRSRG